MPANNAADSLDRLFKESPLRMIPFPHGDAAAALKENSRKFALLFVALEARSEPPAWRVKPKLHLFQEMCETTDSCPSLCWGYRDEDFGGSLSQLSRRRGGSNNPASTAKSVLVRFMAKHAVPILA